MNFRSKLLWVLLTLSSANAMAQTDSVRTSVSGGAPVMTSNTLGTATTTLQLAANVYPSTQNQAVIWSIISNTATGSINTSGLLTVNAQTSGYVWVKATSVSDATKSDSVKVLVYCKPSHTNPLNWFNIDTVRIENTTLNSGTTSVGNAGAYVTFPATGNTTANLMKDNTYTLFTQVTSPAGMFAPDTTMNTYSASAWIDYNRNGVFENNEWIQLEDSALNRFSQNSIVVPPTASEGYTMMRVRVRLQGSSNGINDMCLGYTGSGQTEDYIVNLVNQPTCAGDPGPNVGDLGCVSFNYNGSTVIYPTVRGADGQIWLQKNLGASQVATALSDAAAYGDAFQWGRWADGHQSRTSATSTTPPTPNDPTGLGAGTNTFYISSSWWTGRAITDTWNAPTPAATTSTNGCDPCKQLGNGWHLPSSTEWQTVVTAESITGAASGLTSNLKLAGGGVRNSSGNYDFVGTRGYYWSNEPASTGGKFVYLSAAVQPTSGGPRGQGASIRCIRSGYVDSVVVSVQGNASPTIATQAGTLQMVGTVYPSAANQNVSWSIVPVTGTATITTSGLITAGINGTVWAKAVSVQDANKMDSVQITISNQIIPIDSVTVATQGNTPATITTNSGTLALLATVHPATAIQGVNWSISPVTGNATITTTGIVTAQTNGTVWAKAVSVQDATKADSILITISGQLILIDSVTVNTQGNVAATITIPQGILQLEGAVHPAGANQSLMWTTIAVSGNANIDATGKVTAVANGDVWVKAVSVQDPSMSDSILVSISGQTLSVQKLAQGKIKVYPNPASARIIIEIPEANSNTTLQIHSISGVVMHTLKSVSKQQMLDVRGYVPGMYIITLQADEVERILFNITR